MRLIRRNLIRASFFVSLAFSLAFPTRGADRGRGAPDDTTSHTPNDKPRRVGSPFVELHSWIYPAMERLAALGLVNGVRRA
jgi:hypothetical protein